MMSRTSPRFRRCLAGLAIALMGGSSQAQEAPAPAPGGPTTIVPPTNSGDALLLRASGRFNAAAGADLTSFAAGISPKSRETLRAQAERLLAEARRHQAADRWRPALAAAAAAIVLDPAGEDAYELRAELFADKKLSAHAIAAVTEGLAVRPEVASLWAYRGLYRCQERDTAGGQSDFTEAIRRARGRPATIVWVRNIRASALSAAGDYPASVAAYDALIHSGNPDADQFLGRGHAHLSLGAVELALADFERAEALDPSPAHRRWRGAAHLAAGHFAAALADLEPLRAEFAADLFTQLRVALALFANGRSAESIAHLDSLLAQNPGKIQLGIARGWAALLTGDWAGAHTWLNGLTEISTRRIMFGLGCGPSLLTNRTADAALADFEARCRVAPNLPFAVCWRVGPEARTAINPDAQFFGAIVCRLTHAPDVAPWLVLSVKVENMAQPGRLYAHLGEIIAAACLRDPAKLRTAAENWADWLIPAPPPTLRDLLTGA